MNRDDIQLKAQEFLNSKSLNLRVGLGISMGVGKTLICLNYIDSLDKPDYKVLVVAPKISIFRSWKDEMNKHNLSHLINNIQFTTYISLPKKDLKLYDLVILDECHNLLNKHDSVLSTFTGGIIGVTGTPPKNISSEKGTMVNKYCPILFTYVTDNAVTDGILNDYVIYIHMIELSEDNNIYKAHYKNKGGYYTSELKDYNYWCNRIDSATASRDIQMKRIMRMKAMMNYESKEKYAKELFEYITDKVILFANTKEQAKKLCNHSYYSGNKLSEENLDLFKKGVIKKLSCVLQLSEGISIPDLKQGIIMHAYGNERKSSQRLGRMLRLKPDEKGIIHILCYKDTVDETWVKKAIEDYDPNKIKWVHKKAVLR